ncbi:MAG: DUF3833 family protein [Rhodobacteraceae bacterium]|nr:MAG: DUF3833 family protein [Paracoccaceae bacterium]
MILLSRRSLLFGSLALAACARVPASPQRPLRPIRLEDAFTGRATGQGVFRVTLTGSERRFRADLNGRLVGDRLTVVEDFFYDDGEENTLTWVFDRAGPGRWTGRRDDTVGFAEVVERGDEIRLSYTADFESVKTGSIPALASIVFNDLPIPSEMRVSLYVSRSDSERILFTFASPLPA